MAHARDLGSVEAYLPVEVDGQSFELSYEVDFSTPLRRKNCTNPHWPGTP